MYLLKSIRKLFFFTVLFFVWSSTIYAQTIFQETFNEITGAHFGTDNIGGTSWSSACPTCLTGDYFNVQNGQLEANDTNGEATWETGIITIGACSNIEISMTVKELGTMEGCGTGCNSVDWVSLEYNIDGNGYQPVPNSFLCVGACANINVIYADDLPNGIANYTSGCLGSGSSLQFRIKVQTWAQDEFWIIDDIEVNCVGTAATIAPVASMCETDPTIQLSASVSGGTWSGPGVSLTGVFDPAVAGPGSHPIFYTTGSGSCAGQTSTSIIVTAAPVVGVVSALSNSICEGVGTTLNLTSATGTIQWQSAPNSGGPFTDIAGANSLSVPTGNLTSSMCYRVALSGCGNPIISNVVCVTVHPFPVVSAGLNQSTCSGNQIVLSGIGATTYSWNNGVVNNQNFTPSIGTTIYTVTGTNIGGCSSTDQVAVTVHSLPTVNAGVDQMLCPGSSTSLSGAGADSFSWSNGVVNGQSFVPLSTSIYTVNGTDINGCVGSDNVLITVISNPTIPSLPAINVACSSDVPAPDLNTIIAFIDDYLPNPTVTFVGDISDGNNCNQAQIIRTYEVSSACTGIQNLIQNITISAQNPIVNAGIDQTICEGNSITLSASSTPSGLSFSWDQGISQGVPFTPSLGSTIYNVTAEICGGECISSDQVIVTVESSTLPTFIADTALICEGQEVVFESTTNGSINCLWDFGNGIQSTSCSGDNIVYENAGVFSVSLTVTNAAGCTTTLTNQNFITVVANPIAAFGSSTATISEVNGEVNFFNTSQNATSYAWDFGDGTSGTLIENPSHLFSVESQQNYQVELTAFNDLGCSSSFIAIIQYEEDLVFYVPNAFTPDDDEYNPVFLPFFNDAIDTYNYELLVFDRWGEIVFETHDLQQGWDGTFNGVRVQDGTFSWKIIFKMKNNDDMQEVTGHVTVLR
ncbi:MAG: PKD domain-containing protein [Bacteroidota bacterium]